MNCTEYPSAINSNEYIPKLDHSLQIRRVDAARYHYAFKLAKGIRGSSSSSPNTSYARRICRPLSLMVIIISIKLKCPKRLEMTLLPVALPIEKIPKYCK